MTAQRANRRLPFSNVPDDLNRLVQTNTFIDTQRLTGPGGLPDALIRLATNVQGSNQMRLSRALLSEAFPQDISKTRSKWAMRA